MQLLTLIHSELVVHLLITVKTCYSYPQAKYLLAAAPSAELQSCGWRIW